MPKSASCHQRCRQSSLGIQHRLQGFSLIEFLVASAISIIVLIAAGSTYFTTRQLNQVASERLSAQQDLRNAANLIVRDARQAGTFGCANLASPNIEALSPYAAEHPLGLRTQDNQPNNFGLHVMGGADFITRSGAGNFVPNGNALVFVYGDGYAAVRSMTPNTLAASGTVMATAMQLDVNPNDAVGQVLALANNVAPAPLVLASCNRVQVLRQGAGYTRAGNNSVNLNPAIKVSMINTVADAFRPGQMGISKLVGSAYVVGAVNAAGAVQGLYRFSLDADGTWTGPQLLVANIANNNGMGIELGYVRTDACLAGVPNPNETFQFQSTPTSIANYSELPALVRIRLNVDNAAGRASDIGVVQEYVIDAAVRGGNVCANRS